LYPINVNHREGYFYEEKDQHESHEVLEFESLGLTCFNFRYLCFYKDGEGGSGTGGGHGSVFWHEMMSRPVHAVARGSNVAMLKELIEQCSNVSWYPDIRGVLDHAMSPRCSTNCWDGKVAEGLAVGIAPCSGMR
jgi:hypothetical protein